MYNFNRRRSSQQRAVDPFDDVIFRWKLNRLLDVKIDHGTCRLTWAARSNSRNRRLAPLPLLHLGTTSAPRIIPAAHPPALSSLVHYLLMHDGHLLMIGIGTVRYPITVAPSQKFHGLSLNLVFHPVPSVSFASLYFDFLLLAVFIIMGNLSSQDEPNYLDNCSYIDKWLWRTSDLKTLRFKYSIFF